MKKSSIIIFSVSLVIACGTITNITAVRNKGTAMHNNNNTHVKLGSYHKRQQASPARNQVFYDRQLKQAQDKLSDNNRKIEQRKAQRAAWRAKNKKTEADQGYNK